MRSIRKGWESSHRSGSQLNNVRYPCCMLIAKGNLFILQGKRYIFYGHELWHITISELADGSDTIRKRLAEYEAAGVQEFMLIFPVHATARLEMTKRFAREFIG